MVDDLYFASWINPHHLGHRKLLTWVRYLRGVDELGQEINIVDCLASKLCVRTTEGRDNPRPVLSLRSVFGNLGRNERFVSELAAAGRELDARGAKATSIRLSSRSPSGSPSWL